MKIVGNFKTKDDSFNPNDEHPHKKPKRSQSVSTLTPDITYQAPSLAKASATRFSDLTLELQDPLTQAHSRRYIHKAQQVVPNFNPSVQELHMAYLVGTGRFFPSHASERPSELLKNPSVHSACVMLEAFENFQDALAHNLPQAEIDILAQAWQARWDTYLTCFKQEPLQAKIIQENKEPHIPALIKTYIDVTRMLSGLTHDLSEDATPRRENLIQLQEKIRRQLLASPEGPQSIVLLENALYEQLPPWAEHNAHWVEHQVSAHPNFEVTPAWLTPEGQQAADTYWQHFATDMLNRGSLDFTRTLDMLTSCKEQLLRLCPIESSRDVEGAKKWKAEVEQTLVISSLHDEDDIVQPERVIAMLEATMTLLNRVASSEDVVHFEWKKRTHREEWKQLSPQAAICVGMRILDKRMRLLAVHLKNMSIRVEVDRIRTRHQNEALIFAGEAVTSQTKRLDVQQITIKRERKAIKRLDPRRTFEWLKPITSNPNLYGTSASELHEAHGSKKLIEAGIVDWIVERKNCEIDALPEVLVYDAHVIINAQRAFWDLERETLLENVINQAALIMKSLKNPLTSEQQKALRYSCEAVLPYGFFPGEDTLQVLAHAIIRNPCFPPSMAPAMEKYIREIPWAIKHNYRERLLAALRTDDPTAFLEASNADGKAAYAITKKFLQMADQLKGCVTLLVDTHASMFDDLLVSQSPVKSLQRAIYNTTAPLPDGVHQAQLVSARNLIERIAVIQVALTNVHQYFTTSDVLNEERIGENIPIKTTSPQLLTPEALDALVLGDGDISMIVNSVLDAVNALPVEGRGLIKLKADIEALKDPENMARTVGAALWMRALAAGTVTAAVHQISPEQALGSDFRKLSCMPRALATSAAHIKQLVASVFPEIPQTHLRKFALPVVDPAAGIIRMKTGRQ